MPLQCRRGDLLIYKKQKHSADPGPRAHDIAAAVQNGEFSYVVDKYWVVTEIHEDGTLEVATRRGKRHRLDPRDPNLCRANWWQRIWYRSRYPDCHKTSHLLDSLMRRRTWHAARKKP